MKKIFSLVISILFVFVIGGAAYANPQLDFSVGLVGETISGLEGTIGVIYEFNEWLSADVDLLAAFGTKESGGAFVYYITLRAAANFKVYSYLNHDISIKIGVRENIFKDYPDMFPEDDFIVNVFSIGTGVKSNLYFSPKLKGYIDAFLPIINFSKQSFARFAFNADVEVGLVYDINSNFSVGAKIRWSDLKGYTDTYMDASIGVEYRF